MSVLLRAKLEASYEDYTNHLMKHKGGIPEEHQAAILLRMNFIRERILKRKPYEYKTPTERDWAYVVRREYVYDCNIFPCLDAIAAGFIGVIARQVMVKKFVMWPFFFIFPAVFLWR